MDRADIEKFAVMQNDVKNLKDDVKEVRGDVKELKGSIQNLPEAITLKLDERYASKQKLDEIAEVIEPFVKLRKRLWAAFIASVVMCALIMVAFYEFIKARQ